LLKKPGPKIEHVGFFHRKQQGLLPILLPMFLPVLVPNDGVITEQRGVLQQLISKTESTALSLNRILRRYDLFKKNQALPPTTSKIIIIHSQPFEKAFPSASDTTGLTAATVGRTGLGDLRSGRAWT